MKPVALVTGSSRGIGRAIALALAKNGFRLILHGKTASEKLDSVAEEIASIGMESKTVTFDLQETPFRPDIVDAIFDCYGAVHCLINNAGVSSRKRGDLLNIEKTSFDEQYETNLKGTFFLTQAIAKGMISQSRDVFHSIINITSSNAISASITRGEYCMTKAALSMMSQLFAVRLAEEGINVYEVRPGLIRTDMTRAASALYEKKLAEGFTPINRWGEPDDIGEAIAPIAEGAFRFSTGDAFHVDGGMHIRHY